MGHSALGDRAGPGFSLSLTIEQKIGSWWRW